MSSTRNKRKRPENDPAAMASASRRRSRETRAAPVGAPSAEQKNETTEEKNQTAAAVGEPATKVPPKTSQTPPPESKSKLDKPGGDSTKPASKPINETGNKSTGKNVQTKNSSKIPSGKNSAQSSADDSGTSQAETTTPKQPLHLEEQQDTDFKTKEGTKKPGTDRDAKIRGLIRHRSILLERIKLCRSAAEKRLGDKDYSFVTKAKGSQDMTDEQEIATFRDVTRKANQAAKKSKAEQGEGAAEKRTSLSLRRGSSVGKRMNAALSSLAPGSNATTSDAAPVAPIQPPAAITPGKTVSKPPHVQPTLPKSSSKSAFQTVSTDKQKHVPGTAATRPIPPPAPLNKTSSSSILPSTTKQFISDAAAKNRAPSSKGIKSVSRQSSVAMPLHTTTSASTLPPNRLAPQKVHFSLAVGLRAKREMIQSKLNALLDPKAAETPRGKVSNKKKKSIPPINAPLQLPPRRKTHWDSVLEEMRWLATDFIEERKWKTSAARTIASTIPGPGMSIVSRPASRGRRAPPDSSKGMESADLDKECKMETSDEAMAASRSQTTKKPSSIETPKKRTSQVKEYAEPNLEDLKSARKVGKVLSAMMFELGEATMDSGAFKDTDKLSNRALDRFLESKSRILGSKQANDNATTKEDQRANGDKPVNAESKEKDARMEVEADASKETSEPLEEMPFAGISDYVDSIGKSIGKTRGKVSVKEMANAMKAEKFQFGGEQKHALEFVDRLWGSKPCMGAVLEGPPASGKTIGICSLLWKQRFKGPQLIACSPASVLRWRFEMGRFEDIRVLTVGLGGGICCPFNAEIVEPVEGDVLICEYSTIDRALDAFDQEENTLHSITVDCRHPSAFFACNRKAENQESQKEWFGPIELGTKSWWENVINFLKRFEARRLLVQFSDEQDNSIITPGMAERDQLEILAFRAAFIIGPKPFLSDKCPIQRRVMLWARQKGKGMVADKTARVKRVLREGINPVVFRMQKSLASRSDIEWDVRLCTMPPSQRTSYNKCSSEVRGALAGSLQAYMEPDSSFRSFQPILGSLARLRRQCFHSGGLGAFSAGVIQNRLGNPQTLFRPQADREAQNENPDGLFWRKIKDSPAQPDTALALDMMENSAKLKELASVLIFDCGLHVYGQEEVSAFLQESKKGSSTSLTSVEDDPRKVAVLAVLPEIQLLISIFLNSLGVQHDLLYRLPMSQMEFGLTDSDSFGGGRDLDSNHLSALAYSEQQNSLSRFGLDSSGATDLESYSSTNVVVSSPEQVGCWMCGLGLESSNYIVSVDEDWTCRGDFLLKNLLTRCLGRIAAKGEAPELIQLVCEDTLEERIFGYRSVTDKKAIAELGCQLDSSSFMTLPECNNSAISIYHDAIGAPLAKFTPLPALSLLKLRNTLLSEVLVSSEELSPRFVSGEKFRFLPEDHGEAGGEKSDTSDNTDVEKLSDMAFLREFLRYEHVTSIQNPVLYQTAQFRLGTEGRGVGTPISMRLPVSKHIFPENMMTRQDLQSLSALFYFERQSSASVWKPLAAGSATISLAQLPDPESDAKAPPTDAPAAGSSSATDLADAWQKSGLSCKPDDTARSLLFYGNSTTPNGDAPVTPAGNVEASPKEIEMDKIRFNAYAKMYSASWDGGLVRDGNQGTEGLVFFPPLFPVTRDCPKRAQDHLKAILAKNHEQNKPESNGIQCSNQSATGISGETSGDKKRKETFVSTDPLAPNSKRLRSEESASLPQPTSLTQPPPPMDMSSDDLLDNLEGILDDDDDVAPFAPIDPPLGPLVPGADPLIPDSEPQIQDGQVEGLMSAVKNGSSIITEDEGSTEGLELAVMGFDEDFGLLGAGALPTIEDLSPYLDSPAIRKNVSTTDFLSEPLMCDSEETYAASQHQIAKRLDSMILFVKRRGVVVPPIDAHMKGHPLAMPPTGGSWAGGAVFQYPMGMPGHDGSAKDMNGHDPGKKLKKKVPSQGSLQAGGATARPTGADMNPMHAMKPLPPPNMMHFAPGKDSQQHRLHASYVSRHYATGFSMFESASYQVASLKVKDRVVTQLGWRNQNSGGKFCEASHGTPLQSGDRLRPSPEGELNKGSHTGYVQALKPSTKTGDAAKLLANSQRSALKRSLTAPCRVDFGPFNGGFLSVPSGMTGISPPRSRLGVSLPMGVKASQMREQSRSAWTSADDELLQDSAIRFGMNWMVVARALAGFGEVGQVDRGPDIGTDQTRPYARSARQCRDRWQALARNRPALANEIRKSERVLRESAMMKPSLLPSSDTSAVRTRTQTGKGTEFYALSVVSLSSFTEHGQDKDQHKQAGPEGAQAMNIDSFGATNTIDSQGLPKTSVVGARDTTQHTAESINSARPLNGSNTARRGFGAFSAAKTKKQFVPLTVPGVPTGGQPNQPVPSHASHMQSVEASVAAQWSAGRTEMWPLQILDLAEKYRASARTASSTGGRNSGTVDTSSQSQSGWSGPPRRQAPASHSQRSRAQPSSSGNERTTQSFPAVPNNNSRPTTQRQGTTAAAPQRTPAASSSAAKTYVPPKKSEEKAKRK